jgi:hypothetical protein
LPEAHNKGQVGIHKLRGVLYDVLHCFESLLDVSFDIPMHHHARNEAHNEILNIACHHYDEHSVPLCVCFENHVVGNQEKQNHLQ